MSWKSTGPHNASRLTAVVVNDDVTQRGILTGLLRKQGIGVRCFGTAEEALSEMIDDSVPDLIVTDVYMPGIDGWRFCRLLRSPEYAVFNQVPILVVSATFTGDDAARISADLGAEAFLPSPVDGPRFVEAVRAILEGRRPKPALRVLVAESDAAWADLLAECFRGHGYDADTARNGREAMGRFAEKAYDVAVLDYGLTGVPGDELLNDVAGRLSACVFVMTATDFEPRLALEWMKAGASDCLRKPFDPEDLIERCDRARRERALLRVKELVAEQNRVMRQKSLERRMLLDTIDTQIWYLIDIETYGAVNKAHADFLGKQPRDIAYRKLEKFLAREVADVCKAGNIEVFETRRPVHTEEWIPDARGEKRLIRIVKTPKLDDKGDVEFVVCAGTDITELKQAERVLKATIDGLSASIALLDETGRILLVNRAWRDFAEENGVSADGVSEGVNYLEMCDAAAGENADEARPVADGVRKVLSGESSGFVLEYPCHSPEKERWFRVTVTPFADSARRHVVMAHENITEQRRAAGERRFMERRLMQAEKAESLSRMAGAVVHHFNNMLAVVMGNLEMVLEDLPPNASIVGGLTESAQSAKRAADLNRLILAFLGHSPGRPAALDLSEACRRCLTRLRTDSPEAVILDIDADIPGPVVEVDPAQLDQILTELVVNAREAMAEAMGDAGRIRVSVSRTESTEIPDEHRFPVDWAPTANAYACVTVADAGPGMDGATIDRIFDPFYTDKFTGRGLGLPVVLGIVKSFGGCVAVESVPGRGSVFRVFLPLSAKIVPRHSAEDAAITAATFGGLVLLAEDQEMVRKATATMLKRVGFDVIAVNDGAEAVAVFRERKGEIRLVVTDFSMPRMNGWETLAALRRIRQGVPVILTSGHDETNALRSDFTEQPDAFLCKPYGMKTLRDALARALGRSK